MKRKECEKQIRDLMIQIRDVYRKYNAGGKYLNMFICGDDLEDLTVNNAYRNDDADRPLDMYYEIEPRENDMKHRRLRKPIRVALELLAGVALAIGLFAVYFGAVLQESYKLNPPTDAEIAENPALEVYRK